MDPRTKLAKLREWNRLNVIHGRFSEWDELDEELHAAGVNANAFCDSDESGRANLAALEAEVAGMVAKAEPVNARLAAVAPDMHAILSDAIALLEMTDEGSTPGTDSYTVCVLGNEVLDGLPYASTMPERLERVAQTRARDLTRVVELAEMALRKDELPDGDTNVRGWVRRKLADALIAGGDTRADLRADIAIPDATTRIRELEEALRPFAEAADRWHAASPDDTGLGTVVASIDGKPELRISDLRRAARVLGGET